MVDHARAHNLVGLDLNPRPILLSYTDGKPEAGKLSALPGTKLDRWPPFTIKISALLVIVDEAVPEALSRVIRGDNKDLTALALLVCELFGYAVPQGGTPGRKLGRIILPALGDSGNAVLARALASPTPDFAGAVDFVNHLSSGLRL